jgi:predicted negative regulator of RcsB-dependent stress response
MQAQDAATAYFFKSWSWVEANLKLVALGAGIVVVAAFFVSYYFWHQNQMEITAGQALTQVIISTPPDSDAGQLADSYLKIASDYPDTQTGERALILGATTLFDGGKYAEAQAQFQKYLETYPGKTFSAPAALGVAASLEAQGKIDSAAGAYQRVVNGFSDPNAVDAAKFALAKIDQQQGKLMDAEKYYQDVARDNPNTQLGSEAAFRAFQLRAELPSTTPPSTSSTPPTSFNLSTKP